MKTKVLLVASLAMLGASQLKAQLNVGASTAPVASAMLQVSGAKGFLPPAMNSSSRDAITSPATGLMIFNTNTSQIETYSGTAWVGATGTSFYTADGTLSSARTVTQSAFPLTFSGTGGVNLNSGNVGIGTSLPNQKLDIVGNINLTGKILQPFADGIKLSLLGNDSSARITHEGGFNFVNYSGTRAGANTGYYTWNTVDASKTDQTRMVLDNIGGLNVFGTNSGYSMQDKTRPSRYATVSTSGGYFNLAHSQTGNVFSVDSIGNALIGNKLKITTLPNINSGFLLTTDASGNVGQTSLPSVILPTIIGAGGKNGVTSAIVTPSSSGQYTGWSITIPALSKYLLQVNMVLLPNSTYTNGTSLYIRTSFSTTQPTYTDYSSTYGISGGPVLVGTSANINNNYQIMTGSAAVNNTSTSPLVLYYFIVNAIQVGGYTGSVQTALINGAALENSIIGIPIN